MSIVNFLLNPRRIISGKIVTFFKNDSKGKGLVSPFSIFRNPYSKDSIIYVIINREILISDKTF